VANIRAPDADIANQSYFADSQEAITLSVNFGIK